MSYPAGNPEWAWYWMGFSVPANGYEAELPTEFKACAAMYFGIGDFHYWKREPLLALSDEKKSALIKYLLDRKSKRVDQQGNLIGLDRPYRCLDSEGNIIKVEDEFGDEDSPHFWGLLTKKQCRNRRWPHNARSRQENGYHCRDCQTFYDINSDDYLRTEYLDHLSNYLFNIRAHLHPNVPASVNAMYDKIKAFEHNVFSKPIGQVQELIAEARAEILLHSETVREAYSKQGFDELLSWR